MTVDTRCWLFPAESTTANVIVMSRDRRTLHFNLAVSGDLDQIRILVRASQPETAKNSVSDSPIQTVKE